MLPFASSLFNVFERFWCAFRSEREPERERERASARVKKREKKPTKFLFVENVNQPHIATISVNFLENSCTYEPTYVHVCKKRGIDFSGACLTLDEHSSYLLICLNSIYMESANNFPNSVKNNIFFFRRNQYVRELNSTCENFLSFNRTKPNRTERLIVFSV